MRGSGVEAVRLSGEKPEWWREMNSPEKERSRTARDELTGEGEYPEWRLGDWEPGGVNITPNHYVVPPKSWSNG
ncbi:hypothetical protein E3N88_01747 [Mikania micrantha]|uniref:Uncharacterized protein n=1 Tax=Mikania micrantha TaxID=192012 RepID=A0A5N6Q3R8_9ASTR|nr:hypothetical protein E3N88_01747 [Mikania micrantha]